MGSRVRNLHVVRPPAARPRAITASVRLVVLPFTNLSNDPAQEYFSDGLTEEMITQIGRLCPGRLGVIARTSSMLFKRSAKSASEIGRELSADYLLEGSVRSDGDRIRITAQLIETRTEVHLWAETYDRSLGESLTLQTDVAAHIARSLAMELVPDQVDVLGALDAAAHRGLPGVSEGPVSLEPRQPRRRDDRRFRTTSARSSWIRSLRRHIPPWRGRGLRLPITRSEPARALPRAGARVGASID